MPILGTRSLHTWSASAAREWHITQALDEIKAAIITDVPMVLLPFCGPWRLIDWLAHTIMRFLLFGTSSSLVRHFHALHFGLSFSRSAIFSPSAYWNYYYWIIGIIRFPSFLCTKSQILVRTNAQNVNSGVCELSLCAVKITNNVDNSCQPALI